MDITPYSIAGSVVIRGLLVPVLYITVFVSNIPYHIQMKALHTEKSTSELNLQLALQFRGSHVIITKYTARFAAFQLHMQGSLF